MLSETIRPESTVELIPSLDEHLRPRDVMWFIQLRKYICTKVVCKTKIKKIFKWGKSGSDELDTNKRPHICVHGEELSFTPSE